ncbi:sulfatase-like hydrolase/transferase [Haloplanus litoreus]|uniref:sulfatase-like hydrolase/transferase n=1 Tax=Haloplanus litoreus TaxID=767515 RepID=UPI003613DF40
MPRVALVVLDTLRYDAFDAHFDWLPGKRFEHAYSPSHRTPPVHAAMFCGKYASELGVYAGADALDCPEPTLAESLSAAGVRTRAFSANTYITEHFGFDRGFDEFERPWQLDSLDDDVFDWQAHVDDSRFDPPLSYLSGVAHCLVGEKRTRRSLRDAAKRFSARQGWFGLGDDGAEECLAYLRDTEFEDDEFVFCNLMEAHEPYEPPEAYRTTDLEWLPTTAEIALGETSPTPKPSDRRTTTASGIWRIATRRYSPCSTTSSTTSSRVPTTGNCSIETVSGDTSTVSTPNSPEFR